MPEGDTHEYPPLDPAKFRDPLLTAGGEARARVPLVRLETLWFNTGSLCNITCDHCYMESSPENDALVYINAQEADGFLDEIKRESLNTVEIGLTGGEPLMNPDTPAIIESALSRGFRVLVLTNAMKPLWNKRQALLDMRARLGETRTNDDLTFRVSIDHYTKDRHEVLRGPGSWAPMMKGLGWLVDNGFPITIAGRLCWGEDEADERARYQGLFDAETIPLDAHNPAELVLFPEMDTGKDVPEITVNCWSILNVRPDTMMCATSRMVVKRKGELTPVVVPCTLLPYDAAFDLGAKLAGTEGPVPLNHPHCATFCVLGGASCSTG